MSAAVDWADVVVSGTGGAVSAGDLERFRRMHGIPLPEPLAEVYRSHGVGTFGGFLHFTSPQHIATHHDRIAHLLDDDDAELLAPTADVLAFAHSDNGDLCGWHLDRLRIGEDPVVRVSGFDELPLATSTAEFLAGLPTRDLFGIGPLPSTYERSAWL